MAAELEQRGRDYIVLERSGEAGSFFRKFPRHRRLISANKVPKKNYYCVPRARLQMRMRMQLVCSAAC